MGPFDSIPRPNRPSDGTHYINWCGFSTRIFSLLFGFRNKIVLPRSALPNSVPKPSGNKQCHSRVAARVVSPASERWQMESKQTGVRFSGRHGFRLSLDSSGAGQRANWE